MGVDQGARTEQRRQDRSLERKKGLGIARQGRRAFMSAKKALACM